MKNNTIWIEYDNLDMMKGSTVDPYGLDRLRPPEGVQVLNCQIQGLSKLSNLKLFR